MQAPYQDTTELRQAIIDHCLRMNALGINQGSSGNISVRAGDRMLITPSATEYDAMRPEMIVPISLSGDPAPPAGQKPSTEWHFHRALLRAKPEMHAVIHAHPPHCTALAIAHREIPPCHYMVAAFGGHCVPVAEYSLYGSEELSARVRAAMVDHHACLMANHGAVVVGETLERAMWRMVELEALARQYILSLSVGDVRLLSSDEVDEAIAKFRDYRP